MTKFSDRIKKSAKTSPIILANDYDPKTPNIESKTLKNIKLLSDYLCGIKINFHLLLQLDKKQISKINKAAHDSGLQCIADIKLNDIGNTVTEKASNLYDNVTSESISGHVSNISLDHDSVGDALYSVYDYWFNRHGGSLTRGPEQMLECLDKEVIFFLQ